MAAARFESPPHISRESKKRVKLLQWEAEQRAPRRTLAHAHCGVDSYFGDQRLLLAFSAFFSNHWIKEYLWVISTLFWRMTFWPFVLQWDALLGHGGRALRTAILDYPTLLGWICHHEVCREIKLSGDHSSALLAQIQMRDLPGGAESLLRSQSPERSGDSQPRGANSAADPTHTSSPCPSDPTRQAKRLPVRILKMLTAHSAHLLHPEYLQPLTSAPVSIEVSLKRIRTEKNKHLSKLAPLKVTFLQFSVK